MTKWRNFEILCNMCSCLCTVLAVSVCTSKKKHWNRFRENSKIRHFVISSHLFYWHANHISRNLSSTALERRPIVWLWAASKRSLESSVACKTNMKQDGEFEVGLDNHRKHDRGLPLEAEKAWSAFLSNSLSTKIATAASLLLRVC